MPVEGVISKWGVLGEGSLHTMDSGDVYRVVPWGGRAMSGEEG